MQGILESLRVVVFSPLFDHELRLCERVEAFTVKKFVAQASIEALPSRSCIITEILERFCFHVVSTVFQLLKAGKSAQARLKRGS